MPEINILDLPVESDATDAETIGEYLRQLLLTLWTELDGFDGKRPFGDSNWEFDLYEALVRANVVPGKLDVYGHLDQFTNGSRDKANRLIQDAIQGLR